MHMLSRLENLMQEHVSVQMSDGNGQARGTVIDVYATSDMPSDTIPDAMRAAVDRSHFTVQLEDGRILNKVSGRRLHFPKL
ncbi:MAG TPA: hypothetical protein VKB88_01900 [Bryobacteraceae bacterium]|nr:hypothetical protein [Bryobacteraceae bacterium]